MSCRKSAVLVEYDDHLSISSPLVHRSMAMKIYGIWLSISSQCLNVCNDRDQFEQSKQDGDRKGILCINAGET